MNIERVRELRHELEAERISLSEIAEIEKAAVDMRIRQTDEMLSGDLLDEIESKIHFDAVLAKNDLARMVRDDKIEADRAVRFYLIEVEKYTGTLNQPCVEDILDDEKGYL